MTFRSTFERMIAARERQARRYVANVLQNLDDETLARGGYDRAELRSRASTTYPF